MKKKVLFVITKSNWGGAQRYVFDLAVALKPAHEVLVAAGGNGPLFERLRQSGVRSAPLSSLARDVSPLFDLRGFFELMHLFRRERPDVVHLNSSKAGGVGALAARLAGVPRIIFTSHGNAWNEDRSLVSKLLIWLASWATALLAHRVIVVCRSDLAGAQRLPFCASKIVLIHNGIAAPKLLEREKARERLHLPQETLIVGCVGELTWNKNYHALLRACGALARAGSVFELCIMGGGEERQFLQTLSEEQNIGERVRFLGFVPDAASYLSAFDIFCLPSLKEGLPYVLLEAAHAGLPTVASNVGGIPDVLGGEAGLLAAPRDERALERALGSLISDPSLRQRLSAQIRERVQSEFSLQKMVADTAALY